MAVAFRRRCRPRLRARGSAAFAFGLAIFVATARTLARGVTRAVARAIACAITLRTIAAFAITITIATAATRIATPVTATFTATVTLASAALLARRHSGFRIAEQPAPDAHEHAGTRRAGHRSARCDRRRCMHHDGRRRGRQEGRHGGRLLCRLFLARTGRIGHFRGRRHLVAQAFEIRVLEFILAHATDRILRRVDVEVRHDHEVDVALVLERAQPFALFVDEVGGHFHRHFGDDFGGAILARLFADQAQQRERHRFDGADAADALATRAHLVTRVRQRRAQSLPRHLEQTEAREAPDLDARAIHFHGIAQAIFDRALIAAFFHVDEVDDDQTADVADAQLAGDFVGGFEVGVGGGGFDVAAARRSRGVDVDGHQRFGVVDDDGAAGGQLHLVRIGRFDLAFDLVAREERDVVGVHLQAASALGGHEALHVLGGDLMRVRFVDQHFADVLGEVVAQRARHRVTFTVDEERSGALEHRLHDLVPLDLQVVEVPLQFLDGPADAGRAHDGAHARRDRERIHDLLHLIAIFTLDATADAARARVVRHQHQEATGERDESRERRTFVAALFLFDLDDDVLTFLQHFAHVDAPAGRLFQEVFAGDFLQRQKAVALGAVIDEARFERRLDARDSAFVDVRLLLFARRKFDRKIEKLLAVNQRDTQLFLLRGIDQHSLHGPLYSGMGPTVVGHAPLRTAGVRAEPSW